VITGNSRSFWPGAFVSSPPEQVVVAVAVEVALADDRPTRHCAVPPGLQDRSAVHEPRRGVAAGVLPENVALAVGVEVVGLGHARGPASDVVDSVLGEPQRAVRPHRDEFRERDRKLGYGLLAPLAVLGEPPRHAGHAPYCTRTARSGVNLSRKTLHRACSGPHAA
jgi:hypothetical protein